MKRAICGGLLIMLFFSCNSANKQRPSDRYEGKKATLLEMERSAPLQFLKIKASHHNNLLRQTVVEGEITNTATLAAYKNIQVQIDYLDDEGSVIHRKKEMVNETVLANNILDFKLKTSHVKGAESVSFDIISAVADK